MLTARKPQAATGAARSPGPRLAGMPEPAPASFPLFPLGLVALPTESVPLHIFEDRYKAMIEQCLRERARVRHRVAVRRGAQADRLRVRDRARCSSAWTTGA